MKRLMAALLCLMLIVSGAFAEETVRTGMMMLEGVNEEFEETLFQSEDGYALWYPSDELTVGEKYGHVCFYPVGAGEESDVYFMIVPSEANPADAEALLSEAVGGFGQDAVIGEAKWTTTESGALLGSQEAAEGDSVYRYYLAAEGEGLLLITACFPLDAAEGFSARFDRMAGTIAFDAPQPDTLYEGAGYSIGYYSDRLEPAELYGHECFVPVGSEESAEAYLMIVRSDVSSENADDLLGEAIGGYEGYHAVTWGEEKTLESGLTLNWVQSEQDGRIDRYYLLKGEEAVYCLTASFPVMGEIDYGALFDAMADTFQLTEEK